VKRDGAIAAASSEEMAEAITKAEKDAKEANEKAIKAAAEAVEAKKIAARGTGCGCPKTNCSSPICGCRREKQACWWAVPANKKSGCQGCTRATCLNPLSWVGQDAEFHQVKMNYAKEIMAQKAEAGIGF
jgi:hypothetical protein